MSYTPTTEYMSPLGFTSLENERACYRVWTNQTGRRQIRAHRSAGSTWLDFYERTDSASPWRKQTADPAPATEQGFRAQLVSLGWLLGGVSACYTLTLTPSAPITGRVTPKMLPTHLLGLSYATRNSSSR